MSQTYNALEGELTVRGAATTSRTGATNAVALVGGYDDQNADSSVTAGESTLIDDPTNAEDTFGTSELSYTAEAAAANGVGTLYGVPVGETDATETFSASQTLALSNSPVFDPTVHPDHDLTVKEDTTGDGSYDTDLTVNVVYDDPPSTPSESDTANVNPVIGEIETDSSGDYEVSYTHGDYSTAISNAADLDVRYVIVLTENDSVKSTLVTELASIANDFDFKRGVVGATPEIAAGNTGSYTPSQRDWRLVEVAPARATGAEGSIRTAAAVGGLMAAQPIGPDGSGLFDTVNGITALNTEYRPSQAKNFEAVTSVTRNGVIGTAETTSSTTQFQPVYATEIIDDVALALFDSARSYAGGPQDVDELETLLKIVCQSKSTGSPPLLGFGDNRDANPYDVNVTLGADSSVADAAVTIVPHPIAEEVNISLTVSDGFVEFEGAN